MHVDEGIKETQDVLPIKLHVVAPPNILPHPIHVVVVVKASNVLWFPKAPKAPWSFRLSDEHWLPIVGSRGIPYETHGEPILGCFGTPPIFGLSNDIAVSSQHPIQQTWISHKQCFIHQGIKRQ